MAREKKPAYRDDAYWGRPVPGFGDAGARLLIVGLAPAAHGANRTGRLFTGDGSGDFLMAALHRAGLATLATSRHAGDGLRLIDTYITAAVRCAPPGNKPTRAEIGRCRVHLAAEYEALPVRAVVALGRIAFGEAVALLAGHGTRFEHAPRFTHAAVVAPAGGPTLIASYHPSRQNTNTRRLTPGMLDAVFETARRALDAAPRHPV